jgi:hypothetical protein
MSSYYTVLQFVPDVIADERINVGVIVAGDGEPLRMRFLQKWDRVTKFGANDVGFLKEFVKRLEIQQLELQGPQPWSFDDVRRAAREWRNSIQFTTPRASLKSAAELMREVSTRFLVEPIGVGAYQHRPRSLARDITATAVRHALRDRLGPMAAGLVKKTYQLSGALSAHHFDVVAANGKPLFAAETISLDQADQSRVERDINSAGWALRDVKQKDREFPTAIVAFMPPGQILDADQQANIDRVGAITNSLNVPLIAEAQLAEWSARMALAVRV